MSGVNMEQALKHGISIYFKKYKKAPQAHVLGSRGMLSPLQGGNEGDSPQGGEMSA